MLEGRKWRKNAGASASALMDLQAIAPLAIPPQLLNLLRHSNGGEGPIPVQPWWFQLYPAEEISRIEEGGAFKEFFGEFFVFGDNGGGEAMALDLRQTATLSVICFDMTNIDLAESVLPIATNFDEFVEMVGVEGEQS